MLRTRGFETRHPPHWLTALNVNCAASPDGQRAWCDAGTADALRALDNAASGVAPDRARIATALKQIEANNWWITLARQTHYGLGKARFQGDVLHPVYGLPLLEQARMVTK